MRNINEIKKDYENGLSLTQLSKIERVSRQKISRDLKKINVQIVNQHNKLKFNEHYFDNIDSEEKSYWLGFIFADGCIMNNTKTFELGLSKIDSGHIDKFKKSILFTGKVYNKEKSISCCLRSKHLWETLNNYGCTPRKSLTLKFPNINIFNNKKLVRHFIRGYFDGDGCITYHKYLKTVSIEVSIIGTKDFLNKIIKITKIPATLYHDKRHSDETYSIEYSKDNGTKLINLLYDNSTIYLDRKYEKYIFFKNGSRSIQEWIELWSGNIGKNP